MRAAAFGLWPPTTAPTFSKELLPLLREVGVRVCADSRAPLVKPRAACGEETLLPEDRRAPVESLPAEVRFELRFDCGETSSVFVDSGTLGVNCNEKPVDDAAFGEQGEEGFDDSLRFEGEVGAEMSPAGAAPCGDDSFTFAATSTAPRWFCASSACSESPPSSFVLTSVSGAVADDDADCDAAADDSTCGGAEVSVSS